MHDLRTTEVSSLMRLLHILMDAFPVQASNCLLRETLHLQISMKRGHSQVDIRERLVITRSLNIGIGGYTSSFFDERDEALFRCLRSTMVIRICKVTQEPPSHKIMDYAESFQFLAIAHGAGLKTENRARAGRALSRTSFYPTVFSFPKTV